MQDSPVHDDPTGQQGLHRALPLVREGGSRQHLAETFLHEATDDDTPT
jgi:hypothetical protein